MSVTVSLSFNRPYCVQRVCQVRGIPRSEFYPQLADGVAAALWPAQPVKRGPKTKLSHEAMLELIGTHTAESQFQRDGHRKVWARLTIWKNFWTGRRCALWIMREHSLLSLYRNQRGADIIHDGKICSNAPGIMRGTDGNRVFMVEKGLYWIFAAVEDWNGECVGWHVYKTGGRFAALELIGAGLTRFYGPLGPGKAHGVVRRMDNRTQYLFDHFLNQIRYWAVSPPSLSLSSPKPMELPSNLTER